VGNRADVRTDSYADLGAAHDPDVNLLALLRGAELAKEVVLEVVGILFLAV
jgi:hypothetical protein